MSAIWILENWIKLSLWEEVRIIRDNYYWSQSDLRSWLFDLEDLGSHLLCPYKSLAWPQMPKLRMGRYGQVDPWSSHDSQPSWNTIISRPCLKGTGWQAIEEDSHDLVSACAHTPTHTCIHTQHTHTWFLKISPASEIGKKIGLHYISPDY